MGVVLYNTNKLFLNVLWAYFAIIFSYPTVAANESDINIKEEMQILKEEMQILKQEVKTLRKTVAKLQTASVERLQNVADKEEVEELRKEVKKISKDASEWKNTTSNLHLSGYADANFIDTEHESSKFTLGHFNPIFHYLYKDLILTEAEVEFELEDDGSTKVKLEYASIDLFINDYMTLVGGKFLSPLGQFRQNLHPTWINKLPSAPPGFSGDGAAPEADIGIQLRGGLPPIKDINFNYALYIANGPKAEVEDNKVKKIETEGFNADLNGHKVVGGRIGFLPIPKLEFGLSAAYGKVGLFSEDSKTTIISRDYTVLGTDFSYQWKDLRLRGEYIQQRVSSQRGAGISGGLWKAWYGQASYRIPETKWELILRYGLFDTPHEDQNLTQQAFGIDYWFMPSTVVKIAYEINKGKVKTSNNANRFIVQLAHGF